MATFVKFHDFIRAVAEGEHVLSTAGCQLKVYLSNDTPVVATDAVKTDVTEISTGNGYTGPVDIENTGSASGGTYTIGGADKVITATGDIGPFRFAVIYNETHASDGLVCYHDYGSEITLHNGETFTWDLVGNLATLA